MAKRKQSVSEKRQAVIDEAAERVGEIEGLVTGVLDSLDAAIGKWAGEALGDIQKIEQIIDEVNQQIADLKSEIEDVKGNLEEKFSGTERYQKLDDLSNELDSIPELEQPESVENLDRNNIGSYVEKMDELSGTASDIASTLGGISVEG